MLRSLKEAVINTSLIIGMLTERCPNMAGFIPGMLLLMTGRCPAGWHIPGEAEWDTLAGYLGGRKSPH